MIRLVLILLLLCTTIQVNGQDEGKHAIYGANEINMGGYVGIDASLNYIYNEKYSFRFGFCNNTRLAKSKPSDYSPGVIGLLTLGMSTPRDYFQSFQLAGGMIAKLSESGKARVNISIGLGLAKTKVPDNWQKIDGYLTDNYTWDYKTEHSVSLIINPKFEFPFTRYWGLSISPMLQFYDGGTFFVVGIGHVFGLLRENTPPATLKTDPNIN